MAPTVLIVGATGRHSVEGLPKLLQSTDLSSYRILALTRSVSSPTAQALAKLPCAEFAEQNWIKVDGNWLREHEPAGGQRSSLASLQCNNLAPVFLWSTPEFIRGFRKTGEQDPLSLIIHAELQTGLVDLYDIGVVAAPLLAQENTAAYNQARYVLNGPQDLIGEHVVKMVEQYIGEPDISDRLKDLTMVDLMADSTSESKNVISLIKITQVATWEGRAKGETTSKEILELYAPMCTVVEVLKQLTEG